MIPVQCYRCSQSSFYTDGVRCFCDKSKASIPPIARNSIPLVSEPGNVSRGYYVSDASTQTTDEDFLLLKPIRDASTQTTYDDLLLLKPTQEASTQATESDFSFIAQIVGCHEYVEGLKIIYPSQVSTSQIFDQNCSENHNLSPENMNINNECFHIMNFDRHNNETIEPSPESMNDSHALPKKRTYIEEEPPGNEVQNVHYHEKMFKKQRTDYAEQVNEDGKLNFEGSISFLPAYSWPNVAPENSVNVNKHGDGVENGNSSVVLDENRSNPFISDRFPRNAEPTKPFVDQDVQNSGKSSRNLFKENVRLETSMSGQGFIKCGKCGERFRKESIFKVHVENNCDSNPYKCDKCNEEFSKEGLLTNHLWVHTIDKPFKCDRCVYSSSCIENLITHQSTCFKK